MPLPQRILVPIDFSLPARAALDYAKTLAGALGASLHVLYVMDDPLPGFKMSDHVCSIPAIRRQLERESAEQLETIFTAEERTKFRAELTAEWGSPYAKVLDFAKQREIDLIVMGTHGQGAIEQMLIGSVAERVVRHATCPVLMIPPSRPAAPD